MKLRHIKEYGGGPLPPPDPSYQMAFQASRYGDPKAAYIDFVNLNKEVSDRKQTDMQTINSFLKNVFKGGDHEVSRKKFVAYLVKKGIKVRDRRDMKLSDMEKV